MNQRSGFTLVELMIVISIIGVMSALGYISFANIRRNSNATKMASDFQQINLAWRVWKNSQDAVYPRDNIYGTHPDLTCVTDPGTSQTPANLFLEREYNDPWNISYSYDNDGDTFTGPNREAGVNILASWCAGNGQKYIDAAVIIDRSVDNGNGATLGKVRWFTDPAAIGSIVFMIAPNETQ